MTIFINLFKESVTPKDRSDIKYHTTLLNTVLSVVVPAQFNSQARSLQFSPCTPNTYVTLCHEFLIRLWEQFWW